MPAIPSPSVEDRKKCSSHAPARSAIADSRSRGKLFFGEFGIKESSAADKSSVPHKWLSKFMEYVGKKSSWTFWCMNANSGDTGGILMDDWVTVNQAKYGIIKPYLEAIR